MGSSLICSNLNLSVSGDVSPTGFTDAEVEKIFIAIDKDNDMVISRCLLWLIGPIMVEHVRLCVVCVC